MLPVTRRVRAGTVPPMSTDTQRVCELCGTKKCNPRCVMTGRLATSEDTAAREAALSMLPHVVDRRVRARALATANRAPA